MRPVCALLLLAWAVALGGCGDGDSAAAPKPVILWAVGDGGIGNDASKQVAELVATDDPAAVLYLGDVYEAGTAEEFEGFGAVYGDVLERMWPTPGNHDWPNHKTGYDPFWRDALGERIPHHYAREAGGWDVLAANSQTPNNPAQLAWLHDQVAGAGDCRLAFWHKPRFNAGEHRDEELQVEPLWDIVEGRAAILVTGHDHNMQRFKAVDGTTQYISGAGGKSHYAVAEDDPRLAFSDDEADGALRIALTPGRADLRYVATDGSVLDRSTVTCEG